MMYTVLAFDFGASSGRAIKAVYDGTSLTYNEVHRFDNVPIEKDGKLCWDFDDLMRNVNIGIDNAKPFDSVAFDTWGVD
ncbi:MAG: rhamnulokinase, partial [Oscillospiraceae bacterium]